MVNILSQTQCDAMVSPNIPCHYIFLLCLVSYNTFLFWLKVVLFFYLLPINWLNWSCRLPTLEAKVLIEPQSIISNIFDIQSPTHGLQSILVSWTCVESNWISSGKICYVTSFVLLRNTFRTLFNNKQVNVPSIRGTRECRILLSISRLAQCWF